MKICVFGANGLAGRGIAQALKRSSDIHVTLEPSRSDINLENLEKTKEYLSYHQPDCVIMAAGKVGGIQYNIQNQLNQYSTNLLINENVINACATLNIKRLFLLSSSCIYPRNLATPMREEEIFDGLPEFTNEGYALAKMTALRHLLLRRSEEGRNWSVIVPTNLYGAVPHFLNDDHVIPMLLKKLKAGVAGSLDVWGDGTPKRQFLYNEDLGSALLFLMKQPDAPEIVNVTPPEIVKISDLIDILCELTSFEGQIIYDQSKPNGHPDKTISGLRLRELGWESSIGLKQGLKSLLSYLYGMA